jgi:hypothetical protein
MGWTADAPVIAQHEVKALREMVGLAEILSSRSISSEIWSANLSQSGETRQEMTWSHCEARPSAPDLTRKSVRRAVVRPLEALLDPLALVADGLDDDGHYCTHLGSSFLWGER